MLGAKLYSTVVLRWFSLPNPRDIENPGWTGAFTALEGREGIPVLTGGAGALKILFFVDGAGNSQITWNAVNPADKTKHFGVIPSRRIFLYPSLLHIKERKGNHNYFFSFFIVGSLTVE